MTPLARVRTATLREAAATWRHSDAIAAQHRNASGWFRWLTPEPNMSIHDRIDDLITEIEKLRTDGE